MKKPSPYRDPGAEQRYMKAESKIRGIEKSAKKPFTPCKGCPSPYSCKSAGKCMKKGKK